MGTTERDLEDRVSAVERAVTGEGDVAALTEAGELEARVAALEEAATAVDDRIAELEGSVQALRGFVGGVRAVDEDVERRANAALAKVERLEATVRDREPALHGTDGGPVDDEGGGTPEPGHDAVARNATASPSETPGDGSGSTQRPVRGDGDRGAAALGSREPTAVGDRLAQVTTTLAEIDSLDADGDDSPESTTLVDRLRDAL